MNKHADIDFQKCRPEDCLEEAGSCKAAAVCARKLLEQEEPDEPPMLLSLRYCVGCGDCVVACPVGAVSISSGL